MNIDFGRATLRRDKGDILRYYEQMEKVKAEADNYTLSNSNNPEAAKKHQQNKGIVE